MAQCLRDAYVCRVAGAIDPRGIQGNFVMVVAARKTLTWGTGAAAVVSALLLACAGSNLPRLSGIAVQPTRAWLPHAVRADLSGRRNAGASEVGTSTHVESATASH